MLMVPLTRAFALIYVGNLMENVKWFLSTCQSGFWGKQQHMSLLSSRHRLLQQKQWGTLQHQCFTVFLEQSASFQLKLFLLCSFGPLRDFFILRVFFCCWLFWGFFFVFLLLFVLLCSVLFRFICPCPYFEPKSFRQMLKTFW